MQEFSSALFSAPLKCPRMDDEGIGVKLCLSCKAFSSKQLDGRIFFSPCGSSLVQCTIQTVVEGGRLVLDQEKRPY